MKHTEPNFALVRIAPNDYQQHVDQIVAQLIAAEPGLLLVDVLIRAAQLYEAQQRQDEKPAC